MQIPVKALIVQSDLLLVLMMFILQMIFLPSRSHRSECEPGHHPNADPAMTVEKENPKLNGKSGISYKLQDI